MVDFIELPHWPVFNLADTAICVAAALFVLLSARGIHLDGRRDGDVEASAEESTHRRRAVVTSDALDHDVGVAWPQGDAACPVGSRANVSTPPSRGCSGSPAPRPPTWSVPAR